MVVEDLAMAQGAVVDHIHGAPYAEGEETAAQGAPAASEAVYVHLSEVLVLACTLLTLLCGSQFFGGSSLKLG